MILSQRLQHAMPTQMSTSELYGHCNLQFEDRRLDVDLAEKMDKI